MASKDVWSQIKKSPRQKYKDAEDRILRRRFDDPINYEEYYKDFDSSTIYHGWFYDDSSERKELERKFLQVAPDDDIRQGEYIHWNNSTWICLGVDKQYNNKQKGLLYQCLENTLNWIDDNGYHSFPFYSQSKVLRDPLSDGRPISLVEDTLEAYMQKNDETIAIKENLRFALGVDSVFRVIERIDFAIDNTIKLIMKKDERRPTDDFVNGIAENTAIVVEIEPHSVNGAVATQDQLIGTVSINGVDDDTKVLTWSSSDENVATVDSSGLVTYVSIGAAIITADYNGISSSIDAECTATPIVSNEYLTSPLDDTILIGSTIEFRVDKYVNGVVVPDTFTIIDMVNGSGYTFNQIDGNTYVITNDSANNIDLLLEFNNGVDTFNRTYKLRMW